MKYAVITAGDAKVGEFIARHWVRSIQANCDLHDIDLIVLDYGLSAAQQQALDAASVVRVPCSNKNGHVANLRFRDLIPVIRQGQYQNVLVTDGGDLIIQADVMPYLRQPMRNIHGYREPTPSVVWSSLNSRARPSQHTRRLQARFKSEPTINVGVLFGPAGEFLRLWQHIETHVQPAELKVFGIDQLLISEYLLDNQYTPLPPTYNLMPWARPACITVAGGVILENGRVAAIAHNSGGTHAARLFARFGFGRWRNFKKPFLFFFAYLYHRKRPKISAP